MGSQHDELNVEEKAPQSPKLALTFMVLCSHIFNLISGLKIILYNLLLKERSLVNVEIPKLFRMVKMGKHYVCYRVQSAQYVTFKELWILIKMVFLKYHTFFREDMTVVLPFFSRYSSSCYPSLALARAFKDKTQWGQNYKWK